MRKNGRVWAHYEVVWAEKGGIGLGKTGRKDGDWRQLLEGRERRKREEIHRKGYVTRKQRMEIDDVAESTFGRMLDSGG